MGKISIGGLNISWGKQRAAPAMDIAARASAVGRILGTSVSGEQWSSSDYVRLSKESYIRNVVTFRCINEVARAISSPPWRIFERIDKYQRIYADTHPMNEVLARPNPQESWMFMLYRCICYRCLHGNGYLERIRPITRPGGPVKEMYTHRPDRFTVKPDPVTGQIGSYIYELDGKKKSFDVDPVTGQADVLQLKTFHPLDDWFGLSQVEPAAREIDTSNQAVQWNKALLYRGAVPGMIFTLIGDMTPAQFDDLEKRLEEKFAGGDNAGRSLILTGESGTRADPYMLTPKEMDWDRTTIAMARNICMAFGVPPMIVGVPGEATYANYKEARMAFWENTIIWDINYLRDELNNWLFLNDPRYFIAPELNDVPALAFRRDMLHERVEKSSFMTVNEKRESVGLERVDEGDVILHPGTDVVLGEEPDLDDMNDEGDIDDEGASGSEGSGGKPKDKPKA